MLEMRVGGIFGQELNNLPADKQDIVNHFYEKQIANVVKAGFASLSGVARLQQAEINQNRKNIKGLALTFAEFADSTSDQLEKLETGQKALVSGLQNLNSRIGKTEAGVAFMQSAMFSNMRPKEQLAALKGGLFPDMPFEKRQDLETEITILAKRQEITDSVGKYLNGASELANIAERLGVDSKIVQSAKVSSTAFHSLLQ